MADTFTKSKKLPFLSELLAERGDLSLKDRLTLFQRLARQVQTLHQNGRIHRAISIDAVAVDEKLRPYLPPPAGPRRFGGDDCDPEFCPPELTDKDAVELPDQLDSAADVLQKAGYTFDPRRVDVYQLGVLLCRLVIGEPVLSYIYDATVKARVPAVVQPLLSGSLGFDSPERFENCDRLIKALDKALQRTELLETPTSMHETPARGNSAVPDGDTPQQGTKRPLQLQAAEALPFSRLGHYRIIEQIGAGGMGDVYRGYDDSLDRSVAIKVLPSQLARDEDFVRRFHAEATAAASIAHPNVVPIYFIGEEEGNHFFVMQCVEGESLAERLGQQGQFPLDEALELIGQCLAGLQAAHGCGLIHRDIKPGNILLERETRRAMLVDFGLVRRLDQTAQMTATGVIMGTVDYIAPEQARGRKVDARADIYSLGVLFYQLLSGRLPFVADSPTAMVFQHAYELPFPLEEAVPDLPPPVAQIVERMMAKEPDQRYPDCGAALADLSAYRQGEPLASDGSAWAESVGLAEDDLSGEPKLPEGLAKLLATKRIQVVREWAATMFRRHAPEYIQQMQGTTQQLDAAVSHYRRRRNRLAKLLEEARGLDGELSGEQIEDLEGQLSKADATLARLSSQQEVLKARLQAAVAQQRMESGMPRPTLRRWLMPAAIGGAGLLGVALLLLGLPRSEVPVEVSRRAPPVAPPAVSPNVPPGAALLMTFDKDTMLEVSGFILRVRSLTGRHNGQDVTAQYTPDGKVGGAISIMDGQSVRIQGQIINQQPEYTITAWVKRKNKKHLWIYTENSAAGIIFGLNASPDGVIFVNSWHRERVGNWMKAYSPKRSAPANQWVFVAVRLVQGQKLNKGQLTIRINNRSYPFNMQMVYHDSPKYALVGASGTAFVDNRRGLGAGLIDELAIYQRALSDEEIETLYQMGLRGESLGK